MLIKCAQYKLTTKQVPSVHWIIFWVSTDDNVAAYCIYSVVTDNKTLVHIDCPQILHWICKRYWWLWFIIGCRFLAKNFLVPHPPLHQTNKTDPAPNWMSPAESCQNLCSVLLYLFVYFDLIISISLNFVFCSFKRCGVTVHRLVWTLNILFAMLCCLFWLVIYPELYLVQSSDLNWWTCLLF